MKLTNYFQNSLPRQVILLISACFIFCLIGTAILFYLQQNLNHQYIENRKVLVEKRKTIYAIYDEYNAVFLDMRGYVALNNPQMMERARGKEENIRKLISELEQDSMTISEMPVYQSMVDFSDYYFGFVLPKVITSYENGNRTGVIDLANTETTSKVERFLSDTKALGTALDNQLGKNVVELSKNQSNLQLYFIGFIVLFLLIIQYVIRIIFRNIGKPLEEFSFAANEIAAGREASIVVDSRRKDELGTLSVAFQKMVESIQEKEQGLVAQNEELIAQQDELHAQQHELEVTLDNLLSHEQQLTRRNELIHGISSSLDKKEVLQSVIQNMCKLVEADRGIVKLMEEDSYAAFGLSQIGINQFILTMDDGLVQRLYETKKAFTLKREQEIAEKGYHQNINYSYDLYLPVLSSSEKVEAIMVFSRYAHNFSDKDLIEYETLARQIAISLEKIKMYEQAENNRKLNQDILNAVQEGIQLIDQNGQTIQVNQRLNTIFNQEQFKNSLIGLSWKQWSALMAEQIEGDQFHNVLKKTIESAANAEEEQSFVYSKKDTNQVIKVYAKAIYHGDHVLGTILVHRDITKEYEVDQMKSEFVSTVSHELRTPLASVLGFTELLLNKELKPERKMKYLQTIYNEANRLSLLINDFLDVQRMESGKQTYEKKYVDIYPIIETVIEHQQVNTTLHQFTLQSDVQQSIIFGDKSKLEQVFTNLLSNSIKYSPNGGNITVRVNENQESVFIEFEDEGLGIPNEAIPHLFQKFYRVDNSDHRRIGGTGLGLAIVEEIVKANGGTISVDSEHGKGSIFKLEFPRVITRELTKQSEGTSSNLDYDIMVIEDDLSLAELLKHELLDSGFHVSYFSSGSRALEQLKSATPDAIVLDILLEEDEMDGWYIMEQLKGNEQFKDIPIFVSTALDEKELGFSLGAQEYLVKPYQPSQLSKVIMHTLLSNGKQGQILVPE
ncbi:ATP-binding protein [Peribacillus loiseleuriae]|uniref:ATP-binding protein n=1 Tax=Peribacillus loiseleuriae TaxID=1679170 RepID=UPI0037F9ECAC